MKAQMMREWRACRSATLLGIAALVAPVYAPASGKSIMVSNCGSGMIRIDFPADPARPADHECCRKGCHAANDRRKKDGILAASSC
jgi:hypothetical protein